jgi:hypothetical protein
MISDDGLLRPALCDIPDLIILDWPAAPSPAMPASAPNEPNSYLGSLYRL